MLLRLLCHVLVDISPMPILIEMAATARDMFVDYWSGFGAGLQEGTPLLMDGRQTEDIEVPLDSVGTDFLTSEAVEEVQWNVAFSNTRNQIAELANAALEQFYSGDTEELDLDRM